MVEKKLTGYPSIDKPQLKYYRETPVRNIQRNQTIYELVFNTNKGNMDQIALEYLGVHRTYFQLKQETDFAANAFAEAGLKTGDTVLVGISNCIEAVVLLLALNKLGVVSKWFDVRASEKDIEYYANTSNCRFMIAFDMLLPKIKIAIDNTALEKVLLINPTDSLPPYVRAIYKIKTALHGNSLKMPCDKRYSWFKDFVKNGSINNCMPCVHFDKNRDSIMIQSSGTTGKPKIIVHSDYSACSSIYSLAYSDLPIVPGKIMLNLLPPWIAYALGQAIIYPLTMGTRVILSPTFEPEEITKYIGKFTISLAAPFHYRYLRDNFENLSKRSQESVYQVDCFVSGGDKISAEENANFETTFKTVLVNGYGNNEGWGCLTVNPTKHNRYGTVGIPKYGESAISYDSEKQSELPYGEVGEICVSASTVMLRYENNKEETTNTKQVHPDGSVWIHTGDLGFIDEDGFVHLQGRSRRVIVRRGFKISAYTIEDKITEHPAVKECVAVEVTDPEEEHVPMVFVVFNDDYSKDWESVKQSIFYKCQKEMKEYEVPKYIQIIDELPYTPNGKYDFRLLEKLGNYIRDNILLIPAEKVNYRALEKEVTEM